MVAERLRQRSAFHLGPVSRQGIRRLFIFTTDAQQTSCRNLLGHRGFVHRLGDCSALRRRLPLPFASAVDHG